MKALEKWPQRIECLEDESDLNISIWMWFKSANFGDKQGCEFLFYTGQLISSLQASVFSQENKNVNIYPSRFFQVF